MFANDSVSLLSTSELTGIYLFSSQAHPYLAAVKQFLTGCRETHPVVRATVSLISPDTVWSMLNAASAFFTLSTTDIKKKQIYKKWEPIGHGV